MLERPSSRARSLRVVLLAGLLALLVVRAPTPARAGTDPSRRWFTLTTEHFAIHSHDDGEAFANEVAAYCEEAWRVLGDLFGRRPDVRIHVLAVDDVDAANGFASVLPFPMVTVWAHPPPPDSELGRYANWLKLLVFHELTHIFHLDHSGGVPEFVNAIFGRVWKPNNALPNWFSEGLAVWIESSRTGGGRNHGSRTETYFRAAALVGRLPALSDLTGTPIEHPRGSSWYLYGGALMELIAREAGDAALIRFVADYGRWPPPYALNTLARQATGKTFAEWYSRLKDEIVQRAHATADAVLQRGARAGVVLRKSPETLELPTFLPDGRLAWIESDGHSPPRIVRASLRADAPPDPSAPAFALGEPEVLARCDAGCGRFVATRDGTRLVVATTREYRRSGYYSLLGVAPLAPSTRRALRELPASRRAFDPAPAADGRTVWAARTTWGEPDLARFDLDTGELLERLDLPPEMRVPGARPRVDRPIATADGATLIASIHVSGNRDLYAIDLATHVFRRLTTGAAEELDPILTPDQRRVVYASDRDGVWNVYSTNLQDGATTQLTDVVDGAFSPAISPDGRVLIYRGWTAAGPELRAIALPTDPASPSLTSPADGTDLRPAEPPLTTSVRRVPYHPLPTLLPRSWLPSLTVTGEGLTNVGLGVDVFDPTSRFGLAMALDLDVTREEWTGYATLSLRTGYPDLTFSLGRYTWDRASYVGDLVEPYREEVVYASAQVTLPIPDAFTGLTWGLGFSADLARGLTVGSLAHTPDEAMPFIPREGFSTHANVFVGFSDVRTFALDIAPREGVSGFFNLSFDEPALGAPTRDFTFTFVTRAHMPLPGPPGHTLSFRLGGGIAGGDPGSRSVFTVGGVPQRDLLSDLLNQTSAGSAWLRGFAEGAFSGTRFGLLTSEWRFPLVRVRTGLANLPLFVEDVSVAIFSDVGGASWDADLGGALRAGAGAELRFRLDLFYGLLQDFRLGYARGFGADGIDQVYFLMAGAP